MENQQFEKPASTEEKLDDKWYEKFREIGSFEAFQYLDGDKQFREQEKKKFLEGKSDNPNLDYPKLDLAELGKKEKQLRELRREVRNNEQNPIVNQLYRWKINEKIAEVEMLRATVTGKMRNFRRYSNFFYGKPSPEIFAYTLQSMEIEIKDCL